MKLLEKVQLLLEDYASKLINNENINVSIDHEGELYFNSKKIGYLCKGEKLLKPKVIINNNHYLNNLPIIKF